MRPSPTCALLLCLIVSATSCKTASSDIEDIPSASQTSPSTHEVTANTAPPTREAFEPTAEWTEFAAPLVKLRDGERLQDRMIKSLAIASNVGVWRCVGQTCEHFATPNKARASIDLPCPLVWGSETATSPDGTHLAIVCAGRLHVLDLEKGASREVQPSSDYYAMVVDDRGVLTLASEDSFERIGADSAETFEVKVPARSLNKSEQADIFPSTGRWLGYSSGAYSEEVAWLATDPPRSLALGGGAIINRDTLWVSLMNNGYTRYTDGNNFAAVKGAPKGGAPPHGILPEYTTWGKDGMAFVYERAAFLCDEELVKQQVILLPEPLDGIPSRGAFSTSPTGDRAYVSRVDGSILVRAID